MHIFSKIVFICNCCFVIASAFLIFGYGNHTPSKIAPLQALEGSIAVLGLFLAVILNSIFVLILIFNRVQKSSILIPKFILWLNIILLPIEIWFAFFAH